MSAISRVPSVRLQLYCPPPVTGPHAMKPLDKPWTQPLPQPVTQELVCRPLPPRAPYTQGSAFVGWLVDTATDLQMGLMRLHGFKHHCIETPYASMHAVDAVGSGPLPTVVLLPGFGGEAAQYATLLWRLLPYCQRVVALDPPGHGRSELPDPANTITVNAAIRDTLAAMVPEPFLLIGHSAGGYAAMRYTLDQPNRVLALTLAAPAGGPFSSEEEAYYSTLLSVPTWAHAEATRVASFGRGMFGPLLTAATYAHLSTQPLRALCESDLLRRWLQPEELGRLSCPVLYLWAEKEGLLPPQFFPYFAAHLPPQSEIVVQPGASHCTVLAGKKRNVQNLVDFFSRAMDTQSPATPNQAAA